MKRTLLITCMAIAIFGLAALAYAEIASLPSQKVNTRSAKLQYDSSEVYKSTYKGKYTGADGKEHAVTILASAVKRDKLQSEYAWLTTMNRVAGMELIVKVYQDGKAVLMADDPSGQLIELEVLMPSGDIVEIMVSALDYRSKFEFSVKTVKTMEEVME